MSAKNSQFIANLLQWDACVRGLSDTIVSVSISMLLAESRGQLSSVWFAIRFLFLDFTSFIVENITSHKYLVSNIECIFSAKSFNLGNLSLLTNFQNLFWVSFFLESKNGSHKNLQSWS